MEPMLRILLEVSYEAITNAGIFGKNETADLLFFFSELSIEYVLFTAVLRKLQEVPFTFKRQFIKTSTKCAPCC